MLTYLRYALATFCFAASVGCLALWWRSETISDHAYSPPVGAYFVDVTSYQGVGTVQLNESAQPRGNPQGFFWQSIPCEGFELWDGRLFFKSLPRGARFPLWYAALIFALAAVGVLRVRRQFSIRSALICFTAVAALLGMAVIL